MHILNKYCEHIFVISIDRYNRKDYVNNQLKDVTFEYFDGVDGSLFTEEFYNNYWNNRLPNSHGLGRGNLGCSLSHLNLYKKIYNEKLNNVLILEDDILITDNINRLDEYFKNINNYNLIYFGMNNGNKQYDMFLPRNNNILILNKYTLRINQIFNIEGTNAYFIRDYNFVKNLIDFQSKWLYTADGCLMEYLKEYDLTYHIFLPQIIKTNNNLSSISYKIDKNINI
jgi:GR25 family glycosyltransferase involved in LPS biosynthesis